MENNRMNISAWKLHNPVPAGAYAIGQDRQIVVNIDAGGVFLLSDETAATIPIYAFARRIKPD